MMPARRPNDILTLLPTEQVLISGGDARLILNSQTGLNKYGCGIRPDPDLVTLSSSTGTTISSRAFDVTRKLHQRLLEQLESSHEAALYVQEMERIRSEFVQLCDIPTSAGVEVLFAASGTDIHLLISQLIAGDRCTAHPLHVIMMEACETGSGVAPAVQARHFSDNAALGGKVKINQAIDDVHPIQVTSVALRDAMGQKRLLNNIDAEINQLVAQSVAKNQRVLLIMIDVSKTGLIAPSPACIAENKNKYPEQVEVMVDACQFRMESSTINAYLNLGCMVALTGSKFLTGPVFSGMLLIPATLARHLSQIKLPSSISDYSARGEWPQYWKAADALTSVANWGLLFRLEAALAELRLFRTIPIGKVADFLKQFSQVVQNALHTSGTFKSIAESEILRAPITTQSTWDKFPTIFPFLMFKAKNLAINREQALTIYQQLQSNTHSKRYQLGQPVLCGTQQGIPVSALRICASARLLVDAHTLSTPHTIFDQIHACIEKTEYLVQNLR